MSGEPDPIRGDTPEQRKDRGAFFTPPAIADFLAEWAVGNAPHAKVLDPTCGEAVFLLAASRRLRELGATESNLAQQVHGVDLHEQSLRFAHGLLRDEGLDAHLTPGDFFAFSAPGQRDCLLPLFDAVIGNPPFVRYQQHVGSARAKSRAATS